MPTDPVTAMPPPLGVDTDFSGRRTELQNKTVLVNAVAVALSTTFLLLRLYTRFFIVRAVGLDDCLIVLAWIGCVALFAVCVSAFQYGYAEHLWNVPAIHLRKFSDMFIAIGIVYVWTPACTKFALLVLYHRINPGKWTRIVVYAIAAFVFGYSLALVVVAAGPCYPARHSDPKCLQSLNLFMAISNISTDFLVIALPIPMLHKLHLPIKQKMILGVLLSLGSAVTIVSIVRIAYSYKRMGDPDLTYQAGTSTIYSTVELNVGVICGCLVILKPFFQKYLPYVVSLSSNSHTRSGSNFGFIRSMRSSKGQGGKMHELRSVDPESGENRTIKVQTEYQIRHEKKGKQSLGDGDSTEEIISTEHRNRF